MHQTQFVRRLPANIHPHCSAKVQDGMRTHYKQIAFKYAKDRLHEEQLHEMVYGLKLYPPDEDMERWMHELHGFPEPLETEAAMMLFAHEALQHLDSDGLRGRIRHGTNRRLLLPHSRVCPV